MKSVVKLSFVTLIFISNPLPDSWYSVKFQSLCDELERPVTPERATKYGTLQAYRISENKVAPDTTRISFDFISNCCETHTGTAELADSTLTLRYYRTSAETCRCLCDYRLTYTISDTTRHWTSIKVIRLEKKN